MFGLSTAKELKYGQIQITTVANGSKEKCKAMVSLLIKTLMYMKVNSLVIKQMDSEHIHRKVGKSTKDIGKKISHTELVNKLLQMAQCTMENSKTEQKKDMESTSGQTVLSSRVIGKTMNLMEKVNTSGLMVEDIKDNGETI